MKFGAGGRPSRLEDGRLITGTAAFTDDMAPAGHLVLGVLRAPFAHGRIASISVDGALAMPGIVAAVTGRDLVADGVGPIPVLRDYPGPDGTGAMTAPPRHAVAVDMVRHVGEIVAAVVGETLAAVNDALEAIAFEMDERDAVLSLAAATAPGAPLVAPEAGGNVVTGRTHGDPERVAAAFTAAAHVVELAVENQRVTALPLEPRASVAIPSTDGRVTLHTGSQNPTATLQQLAETLGGDKASLRIRVPDIGGGFGLKGYLYPEDVLVTYFAARLARPVRWRAVRVDEFLGATHARDQVTTIAAAFDADLRVTAMRSHTLVNVGAYPHPAGPILALMLGPKVAASVYDIPAVAIAVEGVLTNTQATAPYRGAGRPEAIYAMERLMDHAAARFGVDPAELRARSLIRPEAMPYRTALGETFDSGNFPEVLAQILRAADWDGFPSRRSGSAAQGRLRGRGLSMFVEWTGGGAFTEDVTIAVHADGTVSLETATIPMGQGLHTSFAQMAGAILEIPPERIRLLSGDTDVANGFGSFGSRSLFVGGSALAVGTHHTLDVLRQKASDRLEVDGADLEYRAGRFDVAGTDVGVSIFDLAAEAGGTIGVPFSHTVSGETWPNGAHVCEVEVDPVTGEVAVVRYTCVDDVGTVVNPQIVEGQIHGGVVQGIGQALSERIVYDEASGQLLTASLQDYAVPRADDLCPIHSVLDERWPCRNNPLGAKGAGESGTVGAPPAVMSALLDALRPLGVETLDMPATPDRVWAALQAARR
ncbi:carbon monoxide dehydrogenase [Acuticoccus sediminis]|uniref:Carbon monoxide dehydrogenase n=1 Tax=Acuticoccus sediminis TaxID=2184697 RepID=A0A8B2NIP3_9HYPH|nr:xanthine dehydrogenase family protein molybdopterin-binding subunit [Acuticoccus sediminis]RAH99255.1 carbon monoxide dehydrogenase [Acuticoccus sediminis]